MFLDSLITALINIFDHNFGKENNFLKTVGKPLVCYECFTAEYK